MILFQSGFVLNKLNYFKIEDYPAVRRQLLMIFRKMFFTVLTVFSIMFLCSNLFGQSVQQIDIADISNNGTNVSWIIKVPFESVSLRVSAPNGEVFQREFKAGSIPIFSPITEQAKFYGNGRFTYELRLTPVLSQGVKEALAESRKNGNSAEVEADFRKRGLLPNLLVESGTFSVLDGNIVTADNLIEPTNSSNNVSDKQETPKKETKVAPRVPTNDRDVPVDNDQQILDDLIVTGSICVGFDCVNNENFGFDTLRLKENNLRIGFDDTSVGSGFPFNDWQITANDSANGGANKFSIDDITGGRTPFTIIAGAPTNSLFVDSSGNLGLGTSTPVLDIHVLNGNTPAMRLEQDGSSGFTAQTWDIAGNEANFFIRDVTNGSRLPFKIIPGAPTNSLFINSNGNVGFGTASPTGPIDVKQGGTQLLLLDNVGKLTINSSLEIEAGGIIFPDGTTQTTAATGGGGGGGSSPLGASFSQYIFGGQGTVASFSSIMPTVDFNRFGIGTNGNNGFLTSTYTIPSNSNLSDSSATQVVYKIRYRDADGTSTAAQVRIDLVAVATEGGGRVSTLIFDSNTNSANGFNTVTVCLPVDSNNFNFAGRGMHLNVTLTGTAAASADFGQIQIYKSLTCP